MKIGVVLFPGSNCDRDCEDAVRETLNADAVSIWHEESRIPEDVEAVLIPGGFSYGDYLRSGAIAALSPVMQAIKAYAAAGKPVIGICNGFQILTEAGLLPGALRRNESLQFQCEPVKLEVVCSSAPFTSCYSTGQVITLPIAHADGNYYASADVLAYLEAHNQVIFRYVDEINGSSNRIAGLVNQHGNVLGMMPHPERSLWETANQTGEGRLLFESLKQRLCSAVAV